MMIQLDKIGRGILTGYNKSQKVWRIEKGERVGCIDMQSLGYFHINKDTILQNMKNNCSFLSEEETLEYFDCLIKDHNELCNLLNSNTSLRYRDNTYIKDTNLNTKNNPYPWLEETDPRRTMTDQQIFEKYINLDESDLTNQEK